jgi:hypothetical protein
MAPVTETVTKIYVLDFPDLTPFSDHGVSAAGDALR